MPFEWVTPKAFTLHVEESEMKIGLVDTMHKGNNRAPNLAIASLAGFLLSRSYEVGILDLYFSGGRDQTGSAPTRLIVRCSIS